MKKEFKMIVLNPLLMFNAMGMTFPDVTKYPYLSVIYGKLITSFDYIFNLKDNEKEVDFVCKKVSCKTLDSLCEFMIEHKQEIKVMHRRLCNLPIAINLRDSIKELIGNVSIDSIDIYLEMKICAGLSDENIIGYADLFEELCDNIFVTLFSDKIEKTKEIENESSQSSEEVVQTTVETEEQTAGGSDMKTVEFFVNEMGNTEFNVVNKDTIKFRDAKKEAQKQIRKEVNLLDKSQGVDLKHPMDDIDADYRYEQVLNQYKIILTKLLYLLNHVDDSNAPIVNTIFGLEVRKLKMKKFKEESPYFDGLIYLPEEYTYKIRFLSYLIKYLIEYLGSIAENCYVFNKDGRFIEYDVKLDYLNNTIDKFADLIQYMLTGKDYGKLLLDFVVFSIISSQKNKTGKKEKKIDKIVAQLSWLDENIGLFKTTDNAITVDTICKLAYMITIHDFKKVNGIVTLNPEFKFWRSNDAKEIIRELGQSIMNAAYNHDINEIFLAYCNADPLVFVKWNSIEEDDPLAVGCVALKYLSFICNSKKVNRIVKRLIQR